MTSPTPYTQTGLFSRYRLIIAIVAPILALVMFSAWVVEEKMDAYRDSADLLVAAQIARAAQSLTRELENERILSTRAVDPNDLQARYELEAQRLNTDERLKALSAALAMPEIRQRLSGDTNIIDSAQLAILRQELDNDATPSAASFGYSRAIAGLTSLAATMAPSDLSRVISAYMDLGNVKDRVGRARAMLTTTTKR